MRLCIQKKYGVTIPRWVLSDPSAQKTRHLLTGFPPRLSHLATRAVLAAKLRRSFAEAHSLSDDEALDRLERALSSSLLTELLSAVWAAMKELKPRLSDAELLDRVAQTLGDRPLRPGRKVAISPAWNAFFLLADIRANVASDAAQRVMETEQGSKMAAAGLIEVGRYLAAELLRGA